MANPKTGDTVVIDYTVCRTDGTVVGDTRETGPQSITLGEGAIFSQIEEKLTGMGVGDEETVTIASDKAFGPRRDELLIEIPRANLPPEPAPQPGMALQAQQPDGSAITLYVVEVGEAAVKADGNHPLAGEDLTFGITLREIQQAA